MNVDGGRMGSSTPARFVHAALQDATPAAGALTATEAAVADAPKKASPGGAGGMGDMDF